MSNAIIDPAVGNPIFIRDITTSNTLLEGTIIGVGIAKVFIKVEPTGTQHCVMIESGKILGGDEFLRCYSGTDGVMEEPLNVLEDTHLMTLMELAHFLRSTSLLNTKEWLRQYSDFMGIYTVPCKEGSTNVFLKSRDATHYSYEV